MARPSKEQTLAKLHQDALAQFNDIQTALRDERLQCLQDRRFYSLAGAQWEGPLGDVYENKPRMEVNKVHLSVIRIINEYRNNRVTVDYAPKDGGGVESDKLAETCDALYRADEQDSVADEAYDNAFEEAVGGGFGAWRLRTVYEDESDEDNDHQRIRIEPIFDADSSVYFDLNAKRQDKADARYAFVVYSMTRKAYRAEFGDDPSDWPKEVHQYEFDWETPDVVFVAEYYKVEDVNETIRVFRAIDGTEEKYRQADFDNDETLEETLAAIGSIEVRQRKVKRRKVRKYLMSGGKVLDDFGYIAGECIPVVPVYGKRWFVDNIERCMGHVRLAKDSQRLKNMQLSKLAEISALSSVEKPILMPEQVAGHQVMWAEDNLKDYPYLLVNPITGPDGSQQAAGPVAYTKSPNIPPAMAALLQITEADMQEILGASQQADKMVSNVSGKAVELIQTRLDMQTFIYMSNFAKAMKRCGEIWLSMAREIYVEQGRKMKGVGADGKPMQIQLMQPMITEEGEMALSNDLGSAKFDVNVEVGPSSSSKRAATVRALTGMLAITQDQETQQVLQAMALMNMEGEGIGDVQDFFRKKLVRLGVVKPTDQEAEEMMIELQGQPQDPNAVFLQAAAEEAQAKAAKARADVVNTVADAELTQAKTAEIMVKLGGEVAGAAVAGAEMQAGMPVAVVPEVDERKMLELEALRLENDIRRLKMAETASQVEKGMVGAAATDGMMQASQQMQEAVVGLGQSVNEAVIGLGQTVAAIGEAVGEMSKAVGQFADTSKQNTEKALEAISKPRRVVRDKGRVVGIE
jgi:hypothetical protein